MTFDAQSLPKVLQLYLEISQYPILARRIRQRMREEIFARGVVSPQVFEQEVREKAIQSQEREGMTNPLVEETPETWQQRVEKIRDHQTDFYFAYNLPHDLLQEIVADLVAQRDPGHKVVLSFNPELAPWDLLFSQGELYESYPPDRRAEVEHHLREIQVVLIKAMISDQLAFVRVAREYLTMADLKNIRAHRIGRGKIGGKSAGMLLAHKVLQREGAARGLDMDSLISIPESYFIGSDVFYEFHSANDLFRCMNQKYKKHEQMIADYPEIYDAYMAGQLPAEVLRRLADMLAEVGNSPLIVRSSSLLEDNFETSFAGKYDSFFLPNQGSPAQNLEALSRAIVQIYASVVRPEALIYRERMGLTDYDERMAILIQRVQGQQHGRYFYPLVAGVGFSQNPYRWTPRIRAEDGLLRLVTGLGTRAVDRVGSDYPRMVALSHPTLRPERGARRVRHYSQHRMDVIDLEANDLATLPVADVLPPDHPGLGAIVSVEQGDMLQPLSRGSITLDPRSMVVTFDRLLADRAFVQLMRDILDILEQAYERPVDIEFAGEVLDAYPRARVHLSLLQCRSLSRRHEYRPFKFPSHIPPGDILFTARRQVPQGIVEGITYIVYVDPHTYERIASVQTRLEIGQVIGRLNERLRDHTFILMGPGRWGSSNINLGVRVTFADIYNTSVLIEVAYEQGGQVPEVSYGTHFFQDLVEADIYPLPLYPDDPSTLYRESFFTGSPNALADLLPDDADYAPYIRVIDVPACTAGRVVTLVMDSEQGRGVAFLTDAGAQDPSRR